MKRTGLCPLTVAESHDRLKHYVLCGLCISLLIAAAGLRFYGLTEHSLWFDETKWPILREAHVPERSGSWPIICRMGSSCR